MSRPRSGAKNCDMPFLILVTGEEIEIDEDTYRAVKGAFTNVHSDFHLYPIINGVKSKEMRILKQLEIHDYRD